VEYWSVGVLVKTQINNDELVKNRKPAFYVIPAEAGIQDCQEILDPGFRRGDGLEDFSRIDIDAFVKSHKAPFRSRFDTSPRTEYQALTLALRRSS